MKKIISLIALIGISGTLFAVSYNDNEYQQKAREYNKQAEAAYELGDYDRAAELSVLAMENADKSKAYIEMMMNRKDATQKIDFAKAKKDQAIKLKGEQNFPMAFSAGVKALENAVAALANEDFEGASKYADEAIEAFSSIKDIVPLPKFYVVRPWAESKDCFWNISARPYVYNNPTLWENLYQANKKNMKDPSNPDLIYPGMKMEIPSISGEYRDGTYSPNAKYNTFSTNR